MQIGFKIPEEISIVVTSKDSLSREPNIAKGYLFDVHKVLSEGNDSVIAQWIVVELQYYKAFGAGAHGVSQGAPRPHFLRSSRSSFGT